MTVANISRLGADRWSRLIHTSLPGLCLAAGLVSQTRAEGASMPAVATSPLYSNECTACHLAYPPGLLPAASWQHLLDNLPRHFGTDASLEASAAAELSKWLQANAASFKKVRRDSAPPPEDRITRSTWFVREHREVAADVWRRAAVNGASNCAACHTNAAQGRFSEHDIRIPK